MEKRICVKVWSLLDPCGTCPNFWRRSEEHPEPEVRELTEVKAWSLLGPCGACPNLRGTSEEHHVHDVRELQEVKETVTM